MSSMPLPLLALVLSSSLPLAAAHAAGIWVGLCGELAGNPLVIPVLVGLGLDELSMNAPAIPAVKQRIRQLTMDRAREIAAKALSLDTATAVREWLTTVSKRAL
jgi:phosphoenolpyruvate-protein kinase (PTS system EI component)